MLLHSRPAFKGAAQVIAVLFACSASSAGAATESTLGPTARASVRIQLTVAPRFGLRWSAGGHAQARACLISSSPARRLVLTLHAASRQGAATDTPADPARSRAIQLPHELASPDCPDGIALGPIAARWPAGTALLIVAQD